MHQMQNHLNATGVHLREGGLQEEMIELSQSEVSEVRIHQGREEERTFQAEDLARAKGRWWEEAWPKLMSEAAEGRAPVQEEVGDGAGQACSLAAHVQSSEKTAEVRSKDGT